MNPQGTNLTRFRRRAGEERGVIDVPPGERVDVVATIVRRDESAQRAGVRLQLAFEDELRNHHRELRGSAHATLVATQTFTVGKAS